MTPATFPESNAIFRPPLDLEESQCFSIPAYRGVIEGGSVDGSTQVVVAHDLSPDEVNGLLVNPRIYLSVIGGLPPHFLSFSFHDATHPA